MFSLHVRSQKQTSFNDTNLDRFPRVHCSNHSAHERVHRDDTRKVGDGRVWSGQGGEVCDIEIDWGISFSLNVGKKPEFS